MEFEINIYNNSGKKPLPARKVEQTILRALAGEAIDRAAINIIYVDDKEIHRLNKQYLNHDFTTDVISFDLSDDKGPEIFGEIYISVDTAQSQAADYRVSLTNELMRLAVHGTLHLCGYDDDTTEKRARMAELETKYIS